MLHQSRILHANGTRALYGAAERPAGAHVTESVIGRRILPPAAGRWRVVLPAGMIPGDGTQTTLGSWDLADLMDQLDAIFPPEGGQS